MRLVVIFAAVVVVIVHLCSYTGLLLVSISQPMLASHDDSIKCNKQNRNKNKLRNKISLSQIFVHGIFFSLATTYFQYIRFSYGIFLPHLLAFSLFFVVLYVFAVLSVHVRHFLTSLSSTGCTLSQHY